MDTFPLYLFFLVVGTGSAGGLRKALSDIPIVAPYRDEITAVVIWGLLVYYVLRWPWVFAGTDELNLERWLLTVSVPWAICVLGLPMVGPRLWAAVKAALNHGAGQWFFTVAVGILSYGVFILSQWFADRAIMGLMQTHPDQFPGAQRLLTAVGAVYGWLGAFYLIAALVLILVPVMEHRAAGKPFLISSTSLPVLFALLMISTIMTSAIPRVLPTNALGHRMSLEESLILAASFTPNRLVEGVLRSETGEFVQQAHLACRNLPADAYVAFVHPDEVVPSKVVAAEPKSGEVAENAPAYRYRLAECENSNNPDDVK